MRFCSIVYVSAKRDHRQERSFEQPQQNDVIHQREQRLHRDRQRKAAQRRVKIMNNSGITDTASYDKSTNDSRHGLIEVSATCIIDKDKAIAVTNAILSVISPSYWSRLLKFEKDNDHISTSTDPVVIFF